ncbi:MAG: CoA-binding protein, partial [Myxococcota bacterium]
AAVTAAREAGSAPSTALAAGLACLGPKAVERSRAAVDAFVDAYALGELEDPLAAGAAAAPEALTLPGDVVPSARGAAMNAALGARGLRPAFVDVLRARGAAEDPELLLGALAATLAWRPLRRRRISRLTARNLPWNLRLFGAMLGGALPAEAHGPESLAGMATGTLLAEGSLGALALRALGGTGTDAADVRAVERLVGLLLTNGPGTISAQGAKGAVSADGPQTPERVHLHKAMMGFLTHSGFSHGGNGFEGVALLLETFGASGLEDPGAAGDAGLNLEAMAREHARRYAEAKARAKAVGERVRAIPGINHPVFRGRPVNVDPREVHLRRLLEREGQRNVFHAYYGTLVRALHDEGVTRNVFAVNVDAVIAATLLRLLWQPYRAGRLETSDLERAAFHVFLFGRMIGCAAEIDDHLNRGRNMDTRTPASACRFVS